MKEKIKEILKVENIFMYISLVWVFYSIYNACYDIYIYSIEGLNIHLTEGIGYVIASTITPFMWFGLFLTLRYYHSNKYNDTQKQVVENTNAFEDNNTSDIDDIKEEKNENIELTKLTKKDLLSLCEEKGIKVKSKSKKDEIIKLLSDEE